MTGPRDTTIERNRRLWAAWKAGATRVELAKQFNLSVGSVYIIVSQMPGYISTARVAPSRSKSSYQRRRSPEQLLRYSELQVPDPEAVARRRAGIQEFRDMLEHRYGRPALRLVD